MSAREHLLDLLDQAEALVKVNQSADTVKEITSLYSKLRNLQRHMSINPVEWVIAVKTIAQIAKRYNDLLSRLVYDTFKSGDAIDMRRAHKAMLRDLAPQAYLEGLNEGGIAEADMDDDDRAHMDEAVSDWLAGQVEYVNQFAADTVAARGDKDKQNAILDRLTMWVDSLRELGALGKAWALQSEMGQWTLSTEVKMHTPDCVALSKLKAHRLAWFTERGYIPGSDRHIGCKCSIISVKTGERLL